MLSQIYTRSASWQLVATCRGLNKRSHESGVPRREKLVARNSISKSVLWEEGFCWKGVKVDGARGPTARCAYSSANVWPWWGKGHCCLSSGWFLPGNKHGVPVPRVSLVSLSYELFNTPKEIGRFRKNQASKRKLTRVMQYARALERTKAILEAGL